MEHAEKVDPELLNVDLPFIDLDQIPRPPDAREYFASCRVIWRKDPKEHTYGTRE